MADLSNVIDYLEFLREDIGKEMDKCESSLNTLPERKARMINELQTQFSDLHAYLHANEQKFESIIASSYQNAEDVLVHDIKTLKTTQNAVTDLQMEADDMYASNTILNATEVNQLNDKYEHLQLDLSDIQNRNICPILKPDVQGQVVLKNTEFVKINMCKDFPPMVDVSAVDEVPSYDDLEKEAIPISFSAKREVDVKPTDLTSIVWVHGKILVIDKANKKLKLFTELGNYVHELLFSAGVPYGLAHTYTDIRGVDYFAMTIPTVRMVYIVRCEQSKDSILVIVASFYTHIGYAGIAPARNDTSLIATVTSENPRVDIIGLKGEVYMSITVGRTGQQLFSFPRYIILHENTLIVSDWRKNCVYFLNATDGKLESVYKGTPEHRLVNPLDITIDRNRNTYIMAGKTGHIHVIDSKMKLLDIIKDYEMKFCPRLLAFDGQTNRIAVTHGSGNVELVPISTNQEITQNEPVNITDTHATQGRGTNRESDHQSARPGSQLHSHLGPATATDQRCPSPGF